MFYFVAKSANSKTAKTFAEALNGKVITVKTECEFNPEDIIINYGRSYYPVWSKSAVDVGALFVNPYWRISKVINKRGFFEQMALLPELPLKFIPLSWWSSKKEALELNKHVSLMSRKVLAGHSGAGCTYLPKNSLDIPITQLYVEYFHKKYEYRIHIVNNEVIDIVQKRAKVGVDTNLKIRTHDRGWVFAHEQEPACPLYIQEGVLRINQILFHLDFGAFDVMMKSDGSWTLCEINSAPAVNAPTTFQAYRQAFLTILER